jgi:NAD(P)-dependent dehydrogenase (short-subunit alcohol dehydrogenase family)
MENIKTAVITGGSEGLGFVLAKHLSTRGWNILINGRNANTLFNAKKELQKFTNVIALSGDVRDEVHLIEIAEAINNKNWKINLLVNNASTLGALPMPRLLDHPVEELHRVFHTNIIAPVSLLQKLNPFLASGAAIVNISSDAGAEAYENWGAYGSSKAGLDHLTAILAKEYPVHHFYAFDPGDMRTRMHQDAFPGENISDRPLPEEKALPAFMQLIETNYPSGRYTTSILKEELI